MLLPNRHFTDISNYTLRSTGMHPTEMAIFFHDNFSAAGLRMIRGTVEQAIESGQRFIAIVHGGKTMKHGVVVDGVEIVDNVKYLVVRDPGVGAYRERLDWF